MRTNSHAIGTRVSSKGRGSTSTYDHTTPDSGLGQSVAPVVLGLGGARSVDLVHLRWPDGVIQCELNLAGRPASSTSTRTTARPAVAPCFSRGTASGSSASATSWAAAASATSSRPGVYSQPDRDESVAIAGDQLQPIDGVLRLSVTEPMDEIAYVDHLRLEVVDRPPGVSATPDERFAPEGPRPTGELHGLADADRAGPRHRPRGPRPDRDPPALGSPHRRRLPEAARPGSAMPRSTGSSSTSATGSAGSRPSDPLVLCLAGWVEYPLLADELRRGHRRRRAQAPGDRAPARRRDLGGHRAPRRLSRRACPG